MSSANDRKRAANLLGALALTVNDRVMLGLGAVTRQPTVDVSALVLLLTSLGGRPQHALGGALSLTQSGTARLVDRLARHGLVTRSAGPDRRTVALHASAEGERVAQEALDQRHKELSESLDVLTEGELKQLVHIAEKLLANAVVCGGLSPLRVCRLCDPQACGHYEGLCPVTECVRQRAPASIDS